MATRGRPRKYPTDEHADILTIVREYRAEAEEARRSRLARNRQNLDLYMGNIDWSHKIDGQSREHLPKLANSTEQMSAFIRRALTQFGDWFTVDAPRNSVLSPEQIRALMMRFLDHLVVGRGKQMAFATLVGDAVKSALLESLLVLKVHGAYLSEKSFRVEPGDPIAGLGPSLEEDENDVWRLRIDLIRSEDYFPDPTGRGLYEIHRVERDWIDVWEASQGPNPMYDASVVERIHEDMEKVDAEARKARHIGQDESHAPRRRRRVVIDECWGTLLGPDGRPLHTNVVTAIANDKYVIREPEKNPFWDRESPIVAQPVMRVPHSTWHKAVYDNVAGLNLALDELFNLILDGGIAAVWGVRQLRESWLEDPRQVSNGVPQGSTLIVKEDAPSDMKVMETVTTGQVPPESLAMFNVVDRETAQAGFSNDVRLGNLPARQTKATELVQAEQNASVLLDAFSGDLEREVISRVLAKSWLRILQFADDIPAQDVVDAVGVGPAFKLSRMSAAERYAMFANGLRFKVHGLSSTLTKAREFQKFMALMQGIGTNPVLLDAFLRTSDGVKALHFLMRALNFNPENLALDEEGQEAAPDTMKRIAALAQMTGGGSPPAPGGGGSAMNDQRAEISSMTEGG